MIWYLRLPQGYSSDGNGQNKVVLKNFLYVYKNYSVLESFAELAREYYLTDVRTVARPDLEVAKAAQNGPDAAADDTTGNIIKFKHWLKVYF